MSQDTPEILLVGTGAVGSFYGGKLSQAGARVAALCRSDYDIVTKKGIAVQSVYGDFKFTPSRVVRSCSDYPSPPDYIIIATKVLPEIDVPSMIRGAVGPQTCLVLLQNGIDIERPVAEAFPDNEVISALAFICVSRTRPGEVEHQDYGRIVIGKYPRGASTRAHVLGELFSRSGVPCEVDHDIIAARWKKLVWNGPFNPISVLTGGADTLTMMKTPETRALIKKIMEEVCLLATTSGSPIADEVVEKNLKDTEVMRPYKTSMLLDYENGRPMEVEAILGNALRIADKAGVSVPHIETLYGLLSLADRLNTHRP